MAKQEMARVNVDILGISELKWTGMGEFNADDYYIYYCGQESLRTNRVAIVVNKRVQNAVLGCNLKNYRMISVHFQDKSFHITVIQVHAPTSNAEEAKSKQGSSICICNSTYYLSAQLLPAEKPPFLLRDSCSQ